MTDLSEARRELVAAIRIGEPERAVAGLSRRVTDLARYASGSAVLETGTALAEVLASAHHASAAHVALALGVLVERGLPPESVGPSVVHRCRVTMEAARPAFDDLVAVVDTLGDRHHDDLVDVGAFEIPRERLETLERTRASSLEAYRSLDVACLPAIACLTRDEPLRRTARADEGLCAAARALREDGASWLHRLLAGVADEEWVVLHPTSRRGFVVRVRELHDHWPLQPLLAAALITGREGGWLGFGAKRVGPPEGLAGRRPADDVVAMFRGQGPQSIGGSVGGHWETYTWRAIGRDGSLAEDMLKNKIWNEGVPEDVPRLAGTRIVVLGRSLIARSWNAGRSFGALGTDISYVRTLDGAETEGWLDRAARGHETL